MTDLAFIGILFASCSFCVGVGAALGWYLRGREADSASYRALCRRALSPRSVP